MNPSLNPKRTVAELKELRALTGDENGAQRVAFTPTWIAARNWLKKKLSELPVEIHTDAAGNLWTTLRGEYPLMLTSRSIRAKSWHSPYLGSRHLERLRI